MIWVIAGVAIGVVMYACCCAASRADDERPVIRSEGDE